MKLNTKIKLCCGDGSYDTKEDRLCSRCTVNEVRREIYDCTVNNETLVLQTTTKIFLLNKTSISSANKSRHNLTDHV